MLESPGFDPWVRDDPLEEGHGNPLQYSCLENPHGQRSLAGYSPRKESDTTEQLSLSLLFQTISDEMLPLWMSLSKKFQCTNLLLFIYFSMGSPNGSAVKNPTAMQKPQETQVLSLGRKDPLEESMATHSSILA